MDILNTPQRRLKTRVFAQEVFHLQKAGSTNQIALGLAHQGYPEGTLVVAEEQTAGRGRWRRPWYSPSGKSLLFSLILRPQLNPAHLPQITLTAGASVARALHRQTGVRTGIKWPNDLTYRGKKLCGILAEGDGKADCLVLGIGINVNQDREDLPPQLLDTATSLKMIKGEDVSRTPLLQVILETLENDYEEYCRSGFSSARRRWLQYEAVLGRKVRLVIGDQELSGEAVGLTDDGALTLRLPQGDEISCGAGEVILCREDDGK